MKKTKSVIILLFAAYALLMLWLLFGQRLAVALAGIWTENYWHDFTQQINLIPMRTIAEFLENLQGRGRSHAFINLVGNVIMFVPLGFFIPCVSRKADTFRCSMRCALIAIVCVEVIQLFALLGSLDVDDVILNMIGAAIGYGIFACISKRKRG